MVTTVADSNCLSTQWGNSFNKAVRDAHLSAAEATSRPPYSCSDMTVAKYARRLQRNALSARLQSAGSSDASWRRSIFGHCETSLTSSLATTTTDRRLHHTLVKADSETIRKDLFGRRFPVLIACYLHEDCADAYAAASPQKKRAQPQYGVGLTNNCRPVLDPFSKALVNPPARAALPNQTC